MRARPMSSGVVKRMHDHVKRELEGPARQRQDPVYEFFERRPGSNVTRTPESVLDKLFPPTPVNRAPVACMDPDVGVGNYGYQDLPG
jgi:hypothetical protein